MFSIKITVNEEKAKAEGFNDIEHAQAEIERIMADVGMKSVTTKWDLGSKWFDCDMTSCLAMISVFRKAEWFLNSVDDWILLNVSLSTSEDLLKGCANRKSISF